MLSVCKTNAPPVMDVWAAAKWYVITKALGSVPGMKVLLLDDATATTVGLVCSQSLALQHQVYHVDKLQNPSRKSLGGFRGVVIVGPTSENMRLLRQELAEAKLDEYHLFFTNTIHDHHVQDLARSDLSQVVRQVQEVYLDYFPHNPELFTLDVASCMSLEPPHSDHAVLHRIASGITALLLALKLNPMIAYQTNSPPAAALAHELSQWTYAGMLHEALGIRHNRVRLVPSDGSGQGQERKGGVEGVEEVVLNGEEDAFYRDAQHLVFGELGAALKSVVDEFQKSDAAALSLSSGKTRLHTIRDIERFMENYPEFKKQQGVVAKHVALTSVLSAAVDARNLLELSELEQELACDDSLTDSFNRLDKAMSDAQMNGDDKLRLVLLYSLRYQVEGERETRFLERSLLDAGVGGAKVKAIGLLRKLAGVAVRGTDVFNKKGIMGAAKGIVKRQIQGVQGLSNVLTRYEPVLASRLAALKMGGLGALRESEFKVLGGSRSGAVRPQQIVVFILGGATYAEARCVAEFNRDNTARGSPMRAVLGSNTMHSTCSYIQDILRYAPPQE